MMFVLRQVVVVDAARLDDVLAVFDGGLLDTTNSRFALGEQHLRLHAGDAGCRSIFLRQVFEQLTGTFPRQQLGQVLALRSCWYIRAMETASATDHVVADERHDVEVIELHGLAHVTGDPLALMAFWQILTQRAGQDVRRVAARSQWHGQSQFASALVCRVIENELGLPCKQTSLTLRRRYMQRFEFIHSSSRKISRSWSSLGRLAAGRSSKSRPSTMTMRSRRRNPISASPASSAISVLRLMSARAATCSCVKPSSRRRVFSREPKYFVSIVCNIAHIFMNFNLNVQYVAHKSQKARDIWRYTEPSGDRHPCALLFQPARTGFIKRDVVQTGRYIEHLTQHVQRAGFACHGAVPVDLRVAHVRQQHFKLPRKDSRLGIQTALNDLLDRSVRTEHIGAQSDRQLRDAAQRHRFACAPLRAV